MGWADRAEQVFGCLLSSCVPTMWPRRLRRLFILTLPFSAPLWAAWCVALFALLVSSAFVGLLGLMAACAIVGVVVVPIIWLAATIEELWSRQ